MATKKSSPAAATPASKAAAAPAPQPKKRAASKAAKPAKPAKAARPAKATKATKAAKVVPAKRAASIAAETTDLPTKSGLPASATVAEDGALLLEDWTPMGQCLDWRAGLQTWAWQADQLFDEQKVPNLAHDSGAISRRNADVLAAWCAGQDAAGTLPDEIVLVELGMGTGLHLRFLLDRFQHLCAQAQRDWYDRLAVYATDVSRGVLENARDRKLFKDHEAPLHLGMMSAFEPGIFRPLVQAEPVDLRGKMHAVYANYVLDLMPMDLFRRRTTEAGSQWQAVLARTWLAQPERVPVYVDLDVDTLRAAIAAGDFRALIALFPLTEVELRTFPVDLSNHPDLATLERLADYIEAELGADHELLTEGTVACHSGGALHVAARIVAALTPDGFASVRDVGLTTAALAAVPRTYSHYGPTAASGVNMVEFDDWFAQGGNGDGSGGVDAVVRCVAPDTDGPRHQASRLLCRMALPEVEAAFQTHFDADSFAHVEGLVARARAEADAGAALELYRAAMAREPDNWVLMTEAAKRALAGGLDPQLALLLATRGVGLNPEYSPDLWVIYGDAAWATGDHKAARQAYAYALEVNPRDPVAHYGVAFVDAERGEFRSAFAHIGEALAHDVDGTHRPQVLRLLDVCLRGQQQLRAEETERLARRALR